MSTSVGHTRFLSVKDAALRVGYSSDYVARLAREGRVLSQRQGRQWLVEVDSLKLFILEMEAQKRLRQEELRRERRADLVARQYRDITHRDIAIDIEKGVVPALASASVFSAGIMLVTILAWHGVAMGLTPGVLVDGFESVSGRLQSAFVLGSLGDLVSDFFLVRKKTVVSNQGTVSSSSCSNTDNGAQGEAIGCVVTSDLSDITLTLATASRVHNLFSDPVEVQFFDTHTGTITPQFRNTGSTTYQFDMRIGQMWSMGTP